METHMSVSFHKMLKKALPADLREPINTLFLLAMERLKLAEIGNPISHAIVVMEIALRIADAEQINRLNIASIAILHDISAVAKIRKADVKAQASLEARKLLEQQRRQARTLHMREGAAIAQRMLILTNEYFGRVVYDNEAIDEVVGVIEIHDNPSLGVPIGHEPKIARFFRMADWGWRLSTVGFSVDIARDRLLADNAEKDEKDLARDRLKELKDSLDEEIGLYDEKDRDFMTRGVVHEIFEEYRAARRAEYGL